MNTLSRERNWNGLLGTIFSILGGISVVAIVFWLIPQIKLYKIREQGVTIGVNEYYSTLFLVSVGAVFLCGLFIFVSFCRYDRRNSPRHIKAINWIVAISLGVLCFVFGILLHDTVYQEITKALAGRQIRMETDSWHFHLLWPSAIPLIVSLIMTFLCTNIFRPRGYSVPLWRRRRETRN